MTIPVFNYTEKFIITGRGELYTGPNPFDDLSAYRSSMGRLLIIDDVVREVRGIEYIGINGLDFGKSVGILVKAL